MFSADQLRDRDKPANDASSCLLITTNLHKYHTEGEILFLKFNSDELD